MTSKMAKGPGDAKFQAFYPGTNEELDSGSDNAESAAVGAGVTLVRIACTKAIRVAIGTAPEAAADDMLMHDGSVEYFGVSEGDVVSVIQDSEAGVVTVTQGLPE